MITNFHLQTTASTYTFLVELEFHILYFISTQTEVMSFSCRDSLHTPSLTFIPSISTLPQEKISYVKSMIASWVGKECPKSR